MAGLPGVARDGAFSKYEGLGNDFVIVEASGEDALTLEAAVALCDRRLGIGADGVLLVLPARSPKAAARMKVINADGSAPEMCGNGLRCVALHVAARGGVLDFDVETDAGLRRCSVEATSPEFVTVDMGTVQALGKRTLEVDGRLLELSLADAGNPHAVLLAPVTREDLERLGPRIATHPSFPEGTNAGFASVVGGAIDLVVWERGVGLTLACGTGACAAVAVACEQGLLPFDVPIDVRLPGGTLSIERRRGGATRMRGPARKVFVGQLAP